MLKKTVIVTLMLVILLTNCLGTCMAAGASSVNMVDLIDEECFLLGYKCIPFGCMLSKFPPVPGDFVCHYVPVAFVETVTGPGQTVIPFIGTLMSTLGSAIGGGSGGASSHNDKDNQQFFEAHMFRVPSYVLLKTMNPLTHVCPYVSGSVWAVNYLSELDAVEWRSGLGDWSIASAISSITSLCSVAGAVSSALSQVGIFLSDACMGTWGVTYPRTGFSSSYSEPVASAIAAYRADRVVADPLPARVVLLPDPTLSSDPLMQLGYPFFGKPLNCLPVGTTPLTWDNFDTKMPKDTGYVWVIWEKTCCCMPATGCVGP